MNTYDPSDRIHYVHLTVAAEARQTPADSGIGYTAWSSGYATPGPRSRLRRRQTHVRGIHTGVVSLPA